MWPDRGRGVEQAAGPWVVVVAGGLIAGVVRCSVLSARHLTPRGISCSPGIVLDEEGPRQERSVSFPGEDGSYIISSVDTFSPVLN